MHNPKASIALSVLALELLLWVIWLYIAFIPQAENFDEKMHYLSAVTMLWSPHFLGLVLIPTLNLVLSIYLVSVVMFGGRKEYLGYVRTAVYQFISTIGVISSVIAFVYVLYLI